MKKTIMLVVLGSICAGARAQETMQQVMEKRAREMHRVICLPDKDQWQRFIKENYTQALIDKPMKSQVSASDESGTSSERKDMEGNLDGKVNMFQRLHSDFGESKIVSIRPNGGQLKMELSGVDLTGTFTLKFTLNKPYLIDGLGIQIEGGNRFTR
ncbi:MAG TPA: hypothetical protein VKQ08_12855 [Cyclobacteriaceae bacterium]|nr:hypothetical protein [Cyclobacteriaceae bacterium]